MTSLTSTSNPAQLGFDPQRLQRINNLMENYVASGKTAGMVTLVSRRGEIVHLDSRGYMDIKAQTPMRTDSIFRIYSMTKAITSVAMMTLLEQGFFQLDDVVQRWIPALKSLKVYREDGKLDELETDITIRQLLTHTAGFSYGFEPDLHPVDKLYDARWKALKPSDTLEDLLNLMFEVPLIAQPGSRWHYSIATDICGHLIELISGKRLGEYLHETILEPLGMVDTGFELPAEKLDRFTTLYGKAGDDPLAVLQTPASSPYALPVNIHYGGGGLVSTASDYLNFAQMMLNGGVLDGSRIIGPKTIDWMTMNQLPEAMLPLRFNGIVPQQLDAYGFGLGYCINMDPARAGTLGSQGDYGWGGLADTYCWIDPKEALIGILMQQYIPSLAHAGRRDFRNAVYQALI